MDILLKDILIQELPDGRNILITAKHNRISFLYVRYSTPASHNEVALWYITKRDLSDGLILPRSYNIVYLAAVYDEDTFVTIAQTGIYKIKLSNGEEFLKALSARDILPVKLSNDVTVVSYVSYDRVTPTNIIASLRSPIDLSSAYMPIKLPRTIEEVKSMQQRTIRLRDQLLAHNCLKLTVDDPYDAVQEVNPANDEDERNVVYSDFNKFYNRQV